jgi:hypothetical protein
MLSPRKVFRSWVTCPKHQILLDVITVTISEDDYKHLIVYFYSDLRYIIPSRSEHLPQHASIAPQKKNNSMSLLHQNDLQTRTDCCGVTV